MAKHTGSESSADKIYRLLDSIRGDFPRRKAAFEYLAIREGLDPSLELVIAPPQSDSSFPTFDEATRRPLSPMCKARFEHSGTWKVGLELWLDIPGMETWIANRDVRRIHKSLREFCDNSAPMQFPDERLGLFGITVGVPQDIVYFVWADDSVEPQIWSYDGMEIDVFDSLAAYLEWRLTR